MSTESIGLQPGPPEGHPSDASEATRERERDGTAASRTRVEPADRQAARPRPSWFGLVVAHLPLREDRPRPTWRTADPYRPSPLGAKKTRNSTTKLTISVTAKAIIAM